MIVSKMRNYFAISHFQGLKMLHFTGPSTTHQADIINQLTLLAKKTMLWKSLQGIQFNKIITIIFKILWSNNNFQSLNIASWLCFLVLINTFFWWYLSIAQFFLTIKYHLDRIKGLIFSTPSFAIDLNDLLDQRFYQRMWQCGQIKLKFCIRLPYNSLHMNDRIYL